MLVLYLIFTVLMMCGADTTKPNIVMIIADDLGWNDVGFHGSNQIPTPNIDALAYSGLILQNYYVTPICTPSRAALMTGKYPIHNEYEIEGMQHGVIYGMEEGGLPLSEKLLPQYLKDLGYSTHLVGKWHLGHYKRDYLPLSRGFDSHVGFWTGRIDMYDHTAQEYDPLSKSDIWGFDFRRGYEVAHDLFGQYVTDICTTEAIKVIEAHNSSSPLFLYIGHSAVHSQNPWEPIRAPDDVIANFTHIDDYNRKKYAGVLSKLDESVGKVVASLQENGLLENSIIIFTTDNGGPAGGFNFNHASNYPLRGVKNTLWEGGIRGAALLWSALLTNQSRVAAQKMHIVDWLPTLYRAANGDLSNLKDMDGINQWDALSQDLKSERTSIVHNIDDVWGSAAINVDQWKLLKGTNYGGAWDGWFGPDGREGSYDTELVSSQPAAVALAKLGLMPHRDKLLAMRAASTVNCGTTEYYVHVQCEPLVKPCLFDVERDPCERVNLAEREPEVLKMMLSELEKVNKTAVPPVKRVRNPRGNPQLWGHVFTNFGDFDTSPATC